MPLTPTPTYVAPNEVIQSAWGNSVVDALKWLDTNKVDIQGDTMTGQLTMQTANVSIANGQLIVERPNNNLTWQDAQIQLRDDVGNISFLSMYAAGVAPILRVSQPNGERLEVQNSNQTAYAAIAASAFTVSSARDTKRDIRPVEPVRGKLAQLPVQRFRRTVGPLVTRINDNGIAETIEHGLECSPETCGTTPESPCANFRNEMAAGEKYGLVAEDVAAALPEVATYDSDGNPVGWDIPQMIAVVVQLVTEIDARLTALEGATP